MKCAFCGEPMTDLTHGKGALRNFICHHCKAHLFKGIWRTEKQWNKWINIIEEDENNG